MHYTHLKAYLEAFDNYTRAKAEFDKRHAEMVTMCQGISPWLRSTKGPVLRYAYNQRLIKVNTNTALIEVQPLDFVSGRED